MATTEKMRNKLINKLNELFQLDQPDLDFGFYRIMHAKEKQVKQFINNDLLKIIEDAFGQADEARKIELQAKYDNAVKQAIEYGAPNPEEAPKVKEAKAAYDSLKDGANSEADVYNHLYRFFERYYDDGDFISRRYYTRENSGKSAPYAIPYNGEEVKLHWANADQYYIKTTEYFSNYTFDLVQAAEFRKMTETDKTADMIPDKPLKVHFRILDATEGEHGNIKAADDKKRFFVLHDNQPIQFNEADELIINFEYKPLPAGNNKVDKETADQLKEQYGKSIPVNDQPNLFIAHKVLTLLDNFDSNGDAAKDYKRLLEFPAPTEKISNRPLLTKYINQYTARNTSDYFIHKDLGAFLKRELDFYIKNEVMHLDDIENADVPAVETYLSKIKAIRKIATKLIEFLAQLEDFQKKLWLKKKFVVETNYCITLDRVPESLYPEIAANDAQREEWVNLFAIDEINGSDGDLIEAGSPAYSKPLTVEFLKSNDKLVLDTRFFDEIFKAKLIESIDDFDEQCNGLLIHSENFQGLSFINNKYSKTISSIYLDPPYNADASEILYKNSYKHSSWLSFLYNRLFITKKLINEDCGKICITIDDNEFQRLVQLMSIIWNQKNYLGTIPIRNNPQGRSTVKGFSINHEYGIFYASSPSASEVGRLEHSKEQIQRYCEINELGERYLWENLRKTGAGSHKVDRPKQYYPIYSNGVTIRIPKMEWNDLNKKWEILEKPLVDEKIIWPNDNNHTARVWKWGVDRAKGKINDLKVEKKTNGDLQIYRINYFNTKGSLPNTWWDKPKYAAGSHGTNLITAYLGSGHQFLFPKSVYAVEDCLRVCGAHKDTTILDYFSGSGTTGHAVINLNRFDNGNRKYILVEMGDYFDTVLKPRISKVIYSENWKNGKPTTRNTGIYHCFKYLRVESYEDTLNNLEFPDNPDRQKFIDNSSTLREDYMLHYMLDVESRGSNSLLNIDLFSNPMNYTLKVKKTGSDEQITTKVDLIESFNYLIGLRVQHMGAPQNFTAEFVRKPDPELPEDQHTKLVVDGKINQTKEGKWWFRKIEGWVPADPLHPNNGRKENVLIVWRNLTGDLEEDNLMLDEWFQKFHISTRDFEYDTIYVNGSNNLPNLKKDDENWKVLLIEETFQKRMWDTGGAV